MAKAMAVGAEIKVIGADTHLWDGADGVWQETTILDVRGAEVGVLQRTTDGVTVRYESGDAEIFYSRVTTASMISRLLILHRWSPRRSRLKPKPTRAPTPTSSRLNR